MIKPEGNSCWHPAAQQHIFRQLLQSFLSPGRVERLSSSEPARQAVLACLADERSLLCDRDGQLSALDWSRLGCVKSAAERADFVLCSGAEPVDWTPPLGTLSDPERGSTVLVEVASLGSGARSWRLQGPGVNGRRALRFDGLHRSWLARRQRWNAAFPLGVELVLVSGHGVAAITRSTMVEEG